MAITTAALTGFEYGFIASAATAGGGLFDTYIGTGFTASTSGPRNGNYCAHLVSAANTSNKLGRGTLGGAGTKAVLRFAVKVSSRPSSGTVQIAHAMDNFASLMFSVNVSSAGVLSLAIPTGTTQTGPTIDTTSYHVIELQINGLASGTIDWKVDGVAQTQAT